MTPGEQLRVLLAMMLCGAALGSTYDALGLLRLMRFAGIQAVLDLAFGVICAMAVIACALYLRVDVLRMYTLAGVLCGMALYRVSIGWMMRAGIRMGKNCPKRSKK